MFVRLIVLGLVLLVMIVAVPRGLVPVAARLRAKLDGWMNEDDVPEPTSRSRGSRGARHDQ